MLSEFKFKKTLPTRTDLYKYLNDSFVTDETIDYLEFGVYKGRSMRDWLTINKSESSRFFGFDSFVGLPTNWSKLSGIKQKGYFTTSGEIPYELTSDKRVRFVKGTFQDTLDFFLKQVDLKGQLVINLDADLYTSTLYVLATLDKHIRPGAIIIFDEFTSGDECRALVDYSGSFLREYEIIAVAGISFQKVAIRIKK
jgi:hypothetical protein